MFIGDYPTFAWAGINRQYLSRTYTLWQRLELQIAEVANRETRQTNCVAASLSVVVKNVHSCFLRTAKLQTFCIDCETCISSFSLSFILRANEKTNSYNG